MVKYNLCQKEHFNQREKKLSVSSVLEKECLVPEVGRSSKLVDLRAEKSSATKPQKPVSSLQNQELTLYF